MEIDKDMLISKVFKRRVIWDKKYKSNRKVVDNEWREIAEEMGVEDDQVLRKMWKYLRNQFAIEMGKATPGHSTDPDSTPEPKWRYFKPLRFLTDFVKPRTSSSNVKISRTEDTARSPQQNEQFERTNQTRTEMNSPEEVQLHDTDLESDEAFSMPQRRRRSHFYSRCKQRIRRLERKKAILLERLMLERSAVLTDDAFFFRSILPFVDQIPYHLKLRFRSRVQQLVEEFVYPPVQEIPSHNSERASSRSRTTSECSSNSKSPSRPPLSSSSSSSSSSGDEAQEERMETPADHQSA